MPTLNDRSSQVKKSSQGEKSHAALQLFNEFISNFSDPDPKINRDILSELLTVGFREHSYPDDRQYRETAGRLSEAVRELLNGIIDHNLDDQIMFPEPGQAEHGSLKFNYSKLDEFLRTEVIPMELAKGFTLLHGGFAELMAQSIVEANCHNLSFIIPECTTLHLRSLIEMFEIIRELEEVKS